jgi:hypothetical protein
MTTAAAAAGAPLRPRDFITTELLERACIMADDAEFKAILARLNAQTEPRNSTTYFRLWDEPETPPFEYLLWTLAAETFRGPHIHERAAALIVALHLHCGVPLNLGSRFSNNEKHYDVALAAFCNNLPAFEALLVQCGAKFEDDMKDVYSTALGALLLSAQRPANALPFLRVLLQPSVLSRIKIDPNAVLFDGWKRGLHAAVHHIRDVNPDVVRCLIMDFGANPTLGNPRGYLLEQAARFNRSHFYTEAEFLHWQYRLDEVARMLQRAERDVALLMSQDARLGARSHARMVPPEVMRQISDLAF